jgi:3-dehydroquinate synthase
MAGRRDFRQGNGHGLPTVPVDASFMVDYVHRLRFTRHGFDPANPVLREVLGEAEASSGRLVAFVDQGVIDAWPDIGERIADYVHSVPGFDMAGDIRCIPGGEAAKNDWSVFEDAVRVIHDEGVCRHSTVLAIGGGAVLDVIGFAAATAHRGVRLVRFPTTTLAQGDAGIGVKNGINGFGTKNFLGSFAVPWAVINDEAFLATLSDRDWRCGLSEAVKVALLKDERYFDAIERAAERLRDRDDAAMRPIVRHSAELHLQHIVTSGDPFELRGARPLDFGHWSAHKLEQLTGFRMRHGEAVAIGVALDVVYSAMIGRLAGSDAARVVAVLEQLGFNLYDPALNDPALFDGLEEFREHLGGRLTITLLERIGHAVDVHEVDRARLADAIDQLASMTTREKRP